MDLLQLEHFLAVCEEGSFTRAAERVFRTQSAVSQSIKKLEEEVGASLLARGTEVTLTEAGSVVLEYARRMLMLRDDATRRVEALKNLSAGSLSIGAHEAAALYLLPGPIRQYLNLFPNIKIGIYRTRMEEVPKQVLDRAIDIGFVKEEPVLHGLEVVEVHSDDMVLIAAPDHPIASRPSVTIRDLAPESFVQHHQCVSTLQKIVRIFEQHDTPCKIVAELWSFENIKSFVREGVGLAVVPRITAQYEIQNRILVEVPVQELRMRRRTLMIYRDQGYLSEPARQLIELVKKLNSPLRHTPNQGSDLLQAG